MHICPECGSACHCTNGDSFGVCEADCGEEEVDDDYFDDVPRCPECDACITQGDAHDSECPYG